MEYVTKIIIGDTAMTSEASEDSPYIANVIYSDTISNKAMDFGSTGSSALQFTVLNANTTNLDGGVAELWVSPQDDGIESTADELDEELIGEEADEFIEEDVDTDTDEEEDDGTDGDTATSSEISTSNAQTQTEMLASYNSLNGVDATITTITTEEEEEPEWEKVGTFVVYKQTASNGQIKVQCYDKFSLMSDIFTPTNATATITAMFADYSAQLLSRYGITVDSYPMPDGTITWNESISFRDAIGRFAGLCGGFADFDEDGVLCINNYVNSEIILVKEDLISSSVTSGGDIVISGIGCNGLVSGVIADISFENPYMTQTILDGILNSYKGIRLKGQNFSAMWQPAMVAGTFVRLMTADEYAGYVQLINYADENGYDNDTKSMLNDYGDIVQIASQTVNFVGDAVTAVNGGMTTVTETENPAPTPVEKKAEDASKTATNFIDTVSTGISVHAEGDTDNKVNILTDGMHIYQDGNEVASFKGDGTTIYMPYEVAGEVDYVEVAQFGNNTVIGSSEIPGDFTVYGQQSLDYEDGKLMYVGNGWALIGSGNYFNAEDETAKGYAIGDHLTITNPGQVVLGSVNYIDTQRLDLYNLVVGNGTYSGMGRGTPSNAFAIERETANGRFGGAAFVGCSADSTGGCGVVCYPDSDNARIIKTGYITVSFSSGASGSGTFAAPYYKDTTITFSGSPAFTANPVVLTQVQGNWSSFKGSMIYDRSTTGFTLRTISSNKPSSNVTVWWMAIGTVNL